jgi:hypothetical protein
MSTLAPVSATISRITLPPVPITSRIFDLSIWIVSMRGAWAESSARGAQSLGHFTQDVRAAFLGLGQSLTHDFFGDPGDLDVHLERGDAFAGAGHLEVHVAQVIFVTQDVGQDGKVLAFQDQAHGDARNRARDRNAGVHHREAAAPWPSTTNRSIR